MTIDKALNNTTGSTFSLRPMLTLKSYFENNKQIGIKFQGKYHYNEPHETLSFMTEYDAFHFIFDFYPFKKSNEDFADSTDALFEKYERHFSNVSRQMGFAVKPSETLMNDEGYQAIISKHFRKAERFLKYNIDIILRVSMYMIPWVIITKLLVIG